MSKISLLLTLTLWMSLLNAQTEGTPDIIRGDQQFTVLIKTENANTRERASDVNVYLYKTKSDKLIAAKTTEYGLAEFSIDPMTEYEVRTCSPDYFKTGLSIFECHEGNEVLCVTGASEYQYVAGGGSDKPRAVLKATLQLSPINIGSVYQLDNVYYDLDESHLRPDGKAELDQLAAILSRNKSITIELSSHTDSRASEQYNQELSQRRAQSCFDYLVSKGISADRVIPKGYGESKLLNQCSDGVECSEAQHQKNRRTEIEVLTYEQIECRPSKDVDFAVKDLVNDADDK